MQTFTYKPNNIFSDSAGVFGASVAGPGSVLTAAQVRDAADLASTDSATFAGLTLTGNLLFTDNLYNVGALGATRPACVFVGTKIVTPWLDNPSATLTLGNSGQIISVTGRLQTKTGSSSAPAITGSDSNSGIYWRGSDDIICFGTNGIPLMTMSDAYAPMYNINLASGLLFGWSSSANPESTFQDTAFARVSAGIAELNNGTRVSAGGTVGTLYVGTVKNTASALNIGHSTVGVTVAGHLRFSANSTYDVGDGTYDPRTVRAATSVLTPLVNNASAALTLGNSTYGVTVPGAATFSGDISMQKTSAQGYIRAYGPDAMTSGRYTEMYHDDNRGYVKSNFGGLYLNPDGYVRVAEMSAVSSGGQIKIGYNDITYVVVNGYINYGADVRIYSKTTTNHALGLMGLSGQTAALFECQDNGGNDIFTVEVTGASRNWSSWMTKYTQTIHDGTNGILSTSSGNLNLVPTGGTVAVTGGITASGGATITGGGLTGTSGVKIGSLSGVDYGAIWPSTVTPSGTNYSFATFATNTYINTPTGGQIDFRVNNANQSLGEWSAGSLTVRTPLDMYADISMRKATQGYIRAYATDGVKNAALYHDSTNGILSTSSGNLNLVPAGGTVAVTGGITASGNVYCPNGSNYIRINTTSDNLEFFRSGIVQGYVKADTAASAINISPGLTVAGFAKVSGSVYAFGAGFRSSDSGNSGAVTQGYLDLWSVTGVGPCVLWTESGVANRGALGFAAASSTLSYRAGGTSMTTGTEVFTIGSTGNITCAGITASGSLSLTRGGAVTNDIRGGNYNGEISIGSTGAGGYFNTNNIAIQVPSNGRFVWASTTTNNGDSVYDTGISRISAGVIGFGTGAAASTAAEIRCAGITASGAVLQTAEVTNTPSGTTQTITLASGNYQTLTLASSTGDVTVTLTVPATSGGGEILIVQHGTTPRDITWAASAGSIIWLGSEPSWNGDAVSSVRNVRWRFNGTNTYLSSSGSS